MLFNKPKEADQEAADQWSEIKGIARFSPEPHGSNQVWVLDESAIEPRSIGSVYSPISLGSNFYGYRTVTTAVFRATLKANRRTHKQRGL